MGKPKIKNIPVKKVKYIEKMSTRKEAPARNFLMPKERKFPYRNKDGSINCNLLRAAIVRAAQHGYAAVEKKARSLYEKYCKKEKEDTSKSLAEFKLTSADLLRASYFTGLTASELIKALEIDTNEVIDLLF